MKSQHLKKRPNEQAEAAQAAPPEQIMSDDLRERIAKRFLHRARLPATV